jgi:hypothetical protein
MSASCRVDDSALKKCQEGYEAFLQVVRAREAERVRRDRLLFQWSEADAKWTREHEEQLRLLEAGRTALPHEIFHNGQRVDCRKYQ